MTPLASSGRRRNYVCMRHLSKALLICGLFALAVPAFAQDADVPDLPAPEPLPLPLPVPLPEIEGLTTEVPETDDAAPNTIELPDYSKLSPQAERTAKLDDMFMRLKAAPNAEDANLVAEEIWAIWLESGSASVNLVLRRGSDAQKKGKAKIARQMFDHVTRLQPDYAEGWARSARLALEEKDFSRALMEASQALVLEPRHFHAL